MAVIASVALSRLDTLLLRAALLDGDAARAAYDELNRSFDLDAVTYGQQRLLPLLHRNLTGLGIADASLGRLRGIRHYHWAKAQVRIRATAPLLTALGAAGVRVSLLKGAALLASVLTDMSLRPMGDIDILVPHDQRATAIDVLAEHGFHPKEALAWYLQRDGEHRMPGWPFVDSAAREIDLHWYLLHLDCRPGADDGLWRRMRRTTLGGAAVEVPSAADQVLHAVAHAARWNAEAILHWAADVVLILRREGAAMDWATLVEEARLRRMGPPVHDALAALGAAVGAAIPNDVMAALARLSNGMNRFEHRLRALGVEQRTRSVRRWLGLFDARRADAAAMRRPLAAALVPYLRESLGHRTRAAGPRLALHAMLGRPAWSRRALGIGAWTRTLDTAAHPDLSEGYAPLALAGQRGACLEGWANPELEGRWATLAEAHLAWRLPERAVDAIDCEIEAVPFWPPGGRPSRIDVWVNEYHAARWRPGHVAGDEKGLRFRIPAAAVAGRWVLVMSFAIARCHTPAEYGLSIDGRPLGFFLRGIRFSPIKT